MSPLFAQSSSFGISPWIVYGAVFGLIGAIAWMVLDWMNSRSTRAEQRLGDISDPTARKQRESKGSSMSRMLEAAAPALSAPLKPKTEKEQSQLKLKLSYAGFRSEAAPSIFMLLKVVGLGSGFVIGGGVSFALLGFSIGTLIRTIACAGILFYLPSLILWYLAKKRKGD